jgi:hypothetical protein
MNFRDVLRAALFAAAALTAASAYTAPNGDAAPAARQDRAAPARAPTPRLMALLVSTAGDNRVELPGVATQGRCRGLNQPCMTDADCCSDNCQFSFTGKYCAHNPYPSRK